MKNENKTKGSAFFLLEAPRACISLPPHLHFFSPCLKPIQQPPNLSLSLRDGPALMISLFEQLNRSV